MTRILVQGLIAGALLLLASGCQSNCDVYCDRYQECVDSNLDVGRCVSACSEYGKESDARADRVEGCAACIDRQDVCSEVTNRCFDDCFGVPTR